MISVAPNAGTLCGRNLSGSTTRFGPHLADGVAAHRERRFHHHAGVAQHLLARVAVQKLVRDVAGDAEAEHEHDQQHQVEFESQAHMLFSLGRRIYVSRRRRTHSDRLHRDEDHAPMAHTSSDAAPAGQRMEGARHAGALPLGIQVARGARARLPGGREARQRRRAAGHEGGGRRPRPAACSWSRCRWRCSRSTACCASRPRCSQELRDVVFVRVTQRAIRRVALGVFRHLHSLSACASTSSARPAA